MDKYNLEKSITLIGPSCVGKSLIAKQLSSKLNMPVIGVDDLFDFIELEMSGYIDATPHKQQAYIDFCMQDIEHNEELKALLKTPKDIEDQKRIVTNLVNTYKGYKDLIGDLSPLYKIMSQYNDCSNLFKNPNECICALNLATNEVLNYVFTKVNQPIIIDPPASYGWQADKNINFLSQLWLMRLPLQIEIMFVKKDMEKILNSTQTVLLLPGQDYADHNAFQQVVANNAILQDLDNYYTTDLAITTNGLFYDAKTREDTQYMKQRTYFNLAEARVKDKLKNNSEVANISDEIVTSLQDLHKSRLK